ncbi:hypothetical protein [Actinokineospora terrae]|uniref:Uncharacterized protein n=1 Tax=Actinokineospora terrae TaxID=155974 RepID=A0A1H9MBZ7_9PSEU|nr:hypothetical protein [Actinokineospora terrae]SER21204.1 hypothetical protein SAMN04487818_10281 [Actinokineospora terrae]
MVALTPTTQGPLYPPSEIMNADGDFVVVGRVNRPAPDGGVVAPWGSAIVSAKSPVPEFGRHLPHEVLREVTRADDDMVLYTLPTPLPCNNYEMVFAPDQPPAARILPSYPLHQVPIPDLRAEDGRKVTEPITLGRWLRAKGEVSVRVCPDGHHAEFDFEFADLIPNSLYTVMSLRELDLDPVAGPTRPGPLGVPNVFVTDRCGAARYSATLPDPFPTTDRPGRNRIINVIVLWMSYQRSYGGAIGQYGLGGDIHAQLKLTVPSFHEYATTQEP